MGYACCTLIHLSLLYHKKKELIDYNINCNLLGHLNVCTKFSVSTIPFILAWIIAGECSFHFPLPNFNCSLTPGADSWGGASGIP